MADETTMKKLCNKCGIWTNQLVLHREPTTWDEEICEGVFHSGSDNYTLLRCLGCNTVSLLHESCYSEDVDENDAPKISELRYPPSAARREPKWVGDFFNGAPRHMGDFLREIYVALHNGSYRLCAIGIRALIEDVMIDTVGEQGTLGKNLTAFLANGYVALQSANDFRTRVIEAGHAAMHRGHKPTRSDIETLLDITEALIASVYVHRTQLKKMSQLPPRSLSDG